MAKRTGTMDISTLLATRDQTVAEFGIDTTQEILAADVAAHNALVQTMVSEFADLTTERLRKVGASQDGEMQEVDEYGNAPTQKESAGGTVGFPLRKFQYNVGWTSLWLKTKTPADMALVTQRAEKAHLRRIIRELKTAIYRSANYTFRDHLVDNVDLPVKRFTNADSFPIPEGPNAEVFDSATHTHYTAEAALTAAGLLAAISNVVEHGHGGQVRVYIAQADEAAVSALAGFKPYPDPRIVFRGTDTPGKTLDISRLDNRAIGIFGAAEVWVKSWAIEDYAFIFDSASPLKPVSFRQRDQTTLQGLRIAAELDDYPLHAQTMEAEFGIGVWNRTNGAVHYFGGGVYADPTINA